jgi:hypothetical protein
MVDMPLVKYWPCADTATDSTLLALRRDLLLDMGGAKSRRFFEEPNNPAADRAKGLNSGIRDVT